MTSYDSMLRAWAEGFFGPLALLGVGLAVDVWRGRHGRRGGDR